jgi:hypothetical protein
MTLGVYAPAPVTVSSAELAWPHLLTPNGKDRPVADGSR